MGGLWWVFRDGATRIAVHHAVIRPRAEVYVDDISCLKSISYNNSIASRCALCVPGAGCCVYPGWGVGYAGNFRKIRLLDSHTRQNMKNHTRAIAFNTFFLLAVSTALPASAHHAMGKATPSSLMQGLLSGFGHPVIGLDHLLFILAVGVAGYCFGRGIATVLVFLLCALAGTLVHLLAPNVPYADAWVALSLILLGVLFFRRSALLDGRAALALFALSGLAHGYAYGEAIIGAEPTPLLAYLAGFTLVQFAIAMCGYAVARFIATRRPAFALLKTAGGTLTAAGAAFMVLTLAG